MLDNFRTFHKTIFGYWSCILCVWLWTVPINNRQVLAEDIADLENIDRADEARKLLEEGIVLYDQQSFTKSKDLWLKSISLYAQQDNVLGEALTWNNIALAHQQLGEWDLADQAIARSFSLLQDRSALNKLPGYWEILAKIENTQGNYQLHLGKAELAFNNWQKAYSYYRRTNNRSGMILTQINQAKALQSLGFTVKALDILESLPESLQQSDIRLKAKGLRLLGTSLRDLGNVDRSALILEQSIALAITKPSAALSWLELGNTQTKQGDRALEFGKKDQAQEYFAQAIESYQEAQKSDSLSLTARLNQLSLLVDLGSDREAEELLASWQFPPQLQPSRNSIYALLNYSRSLTCLRLSVKNIPVCKTRNDSSNAIADIKVEEASAQKIIAIINQAIAQARKIQDPLAEAQAIGQLAEIYEIQRNYQQAQSLNQQALLLLEGKFVADFTYRLEWQLGRIYKAQGDIDAAKAIYRSAIASLKEVRANILFIDPQAQFSFRDRIEPVYREYVDLLLNTQDHKSPGENDLRQAIKTIDALQIAELENFLGCDLSQLIALDETSIDKSAVQIYPIILKDRLVTIVEIPGKPLILKEAEVGRSQVKQAVDALQANLTQSGKTPEVLAYGQEIYRWLIEPLESILTKYPELKTLVFIPDSILRNVPFSVLYDGEEYLLEKDYATVVSPRLKLFAPSPSSSPLKVLIGGVDIPQTIKGFDFGAIAQVKQELNQISARVKTNAPLLNEAFTQIKIEQELQEGDFSAIHWKTHGVFSSDPTATFLVTYQNSINAGELQSLIQTANQREQKPLELLVLSACEAARGDDRAILGLAGLTVRTGARTALSTLWRADDRATTLLMTEFYLQLNLGKTKAEALRQAQLKLLQEEGYFAPFYWGTYLLVGNWL